MTTAMKSALTEDELTVLLAHEHAHLRHHHSRWIQIAETAAALHPLLRPVPDVVRRAAERWADEEAAAGGRRAAAQAVAAAAVARSRSLEAHSSTTLSVAGGDVVERVHALVDPPRLPWARTVAATLIVAIALVSFSALRTTDIVQDVLLPEHETPHLVLQR
ncbi:Peptidase M48, Ste24p precursor [Rhodococcus aetherivorans]|nr:Peptidase M48, Ste24p precursor [Rhodococcus aetherivorans]